MNKIIGIAFVVVVLAAIFFVPQGPSQDEVAIRSVVSAFGNNLKNVSLLAPVDELRRELEASYGKYVTPSLLLSWEEAPQTAPGRLTSSPWPDSILIGSIKKQSDGTYTLTGSVEEITSTGSAGSYPVSLELENISGTWLITKFSGYPLQQTQV